MDSQSVLFSFTVSVIHVFIQDIQIRVHLCGLFGLSIFMCGLQPTARSMSVLGNEKEN